MSTLVTTAVTVLSVEPLARWADNVLRVQGLLANPIAAFRTLTIGFAVITIGAFVAGIVDQIVPVDQSHTFLVESAFTASGFAISCIRSTLNERYQAGDPRCSSLFAFRRWAVAAPAYASAPAMTSPSPGRRAHENAWTSGRSWNSRSRPAAKPSS